MLPIASFPKDHEAHPHPEVLTSPPNCSCSRQTPDTFNTSKQDFPRSFKGKQLLGFRLRKKRRQGDPRDPHRATPAGPPASTRDARTQLRVQMGEHLVTPGDSPCLEAGQATKPLLPSHAGAENGGNPFFLLHTRN